MISLSPEREALSLLRSGAVDGLSIGFRTKRATSDRQSGLRRLLEIDLWEISVVTFPMLAQARIDSVKLGRTGRLAPVDVLSMNLTRLKAHRATSHFETKLRLLSKTLEAHYDANQPRLPAGSREGGRWASEGGGEQTRDT